MRDVLLGSLIGLARATENNENLTTPYTAEILCQGLLAALPTVTLSMEEFKALNEKIMAEKWRIIPSCRTCQARCGRTDNYKMKEIWEEIEEIRSLKLVILSGVQTLASYLTKIGYEHQEINLFMYKALIMIGIYWDAEGLMPTLIELGEKQYLAEQILTQSSK